MKRYIIIFLSVVFIFLSECSTKHQNQQTPNSDTVKTDTTVVKQDSLKQIDTVKKDSVNMQIKSKEYTSRYICPNHCPGSGSDKPGVCPVCGMELIENPDWEGNK